MFVFDSLKHFLDEKTLSTDWIKLTWWAKTLSITVMKSRRENIEDPTNAVKLSSIQQFVRPLSKRWFWPLCHYEEHFQKLFFAALNHKRLTSCVKKLKSSVIHFLIRLSIWHTHACEQHMFCNTLCNKEVNLILLTTTVSMKKFLTCPVVSAWLMNLTQPHESKLRAGAL